MKIAVLSGKGGTGKTLLSVNLAAAAGRSVYIDCDVEEPNGHLFFKPSDVRSEDITIRIPIVDDSRCNGCRKCADFCKFSALAFIKNRPFLFEEVCHSCGGCVLLCPEKAIHEKEKKIGRILKGVSGDVTVHTGILNPGEASGIPIIKKLLEEAAADEDIPVFIDCPPGSACIVMESIKDADYCILAAEPTLFGVDNLNMVRELVNLFGKPHGVVLNKCLDGANPAERFCLEKNIPVLCRIPFESALGTLNSDAKIAFRESERYRALFSGLLETVLKEVRHETAANPQR
ncbi:MAG: ATPase [Clostridia bacterium]|nr:ATPase [Clostridia bacterium]